MDAAAEAICAGGGAVGAGPLVRLLRESGASGRLVVMDELDEYPFTAVIPASAVAPPRRI